MKKIFILISLLVLSSSAWSQDYSDEDQYPEVDPAVINGSEFTNQRGLPATDFEEVPREEQEYTPEPDMDEIPPEEVYEADEEFLE
jgi:hypothetical protein